MTAAAITHGTPTAYNHHACRCDECREANAAYSADLRSRLALRPMSDVPHGTTGGYANWSCRCGPCSDAHGVAMARAYARRKAARVAS